MVRKGATLLEVLIVIALIGGLMSISLPALSSARETARQALCSSNLRQLQLANMLYAGEHEDRFMPGASGIASANLNRWHGVREHAGEPFGAEGAPITSYLEDDSVSAQVRACPSFAKTLEELAEAGIGFEGSSGGYGYNNAFVGTVRTLNASGAWRVQRDDLGSQQTRFDHPSDTIAFTDAAFASSAGVDGLIEYSFAEPRVWPDYPSARPNPSIHFRHARMCNAAMLDGHVESYRRTFSWAGFGYGVDASTVGLGWFGERDSNELFDYD